MPPFLKAAAFAVRSEDATKYSVELDALAGRHALECAVPMTETDVAFHHVNLIGEADIALRPLSAGFPVSANRIATAHRIRERRFLVDRVRREQAHDLVRVATLPSGLIDFEPFSEFSLIHGSGLSTNGTHATAR